MGAVPGRRCYETTWRVRGAQEKSSASFHKFRAFLGGHEVLSSSKLSPTNIYLFPWWIFIKWLLWAACGVGVTLTWRWQEAVPYKQKAETVCTTHYETRWTLIALYERGTTESFMRTWLEEISSRWRLRGSLVKEMALGPNMENGSILAGEGSREEAGGIENGASTVSQGKAWGTASPLGIHEFLKTFELGILACTTSWDHDAIWKGGVLYVSLICVNCTPTDLVRNHIHLRFWKKKTKKHATPFHSIFRPASTHLLLRQMQLWF